MLDQMTGTPVPARPKLFLGLALLYGVIAAGFGLAAVVVFGGVASGELHFVDGWPWVPVVLTFGILVVAAACVLLPLQFLSQTILLLALFWRSLRATDTAKPLATQVSHGGSSRRVILFYPIEDSRWTVIWSTLGKALFGIHWRLYIALYFVLLVGALRYLLPLDTSPALLLLPLLPAVACVVWQVVTVRRR